MMKLTTSPVDRPVAKPNLVPLDTSLFQDALKLFLDESKPDQLARKQAESWTFEWVDDRTKNPLEVQNENDFDNAVKSLSGNFGGNASDIDDSSINKVLKLPQHLIAGTLSLNGEYVTIDLDVTCRWSSATEDIPPDNTATSVTLNTEVAKNIASVSHTDQQGGFLYFKINCHAKFRTKSEIKRDNKKQQEETINKQDKKQARLEEKLRTGIIKRMRSDPYVRRLLLEPNNSGNMRSSLKGSRGDRNSCDLQRAMICEALMYSQNNKIVQERVDVSEEATEGIRRAIFSQADGNIAMMEFILAMPYLPQRALCKSSSSNLIRDKNESSNGSTAVSLLPPCPLANRTKLRLLEDAMVDACEKEGEDELLDDLVISKKNDSDDDSDGGHDKPAVKYVPPFKRNKAV